MLRFFLPSPLVTLGLSLCFGLAGCGVDAPATPAPDLSRLAPCEYGKPIFFGEGGEGDRLKLSGWAGAEPPFTWSDGIAASLAVRLLPTQEEVQLHFRMCGMNVPKRIPSQRVDVYLNSEKLVRWQVADEQIFTLTVPQKFMSAPDLLLIIDFYMPNATAPAAIGVGGDGRRLGVRLAELNVTKGVQPGAVERPAP